MQSSSNSISPKPATSCVIFCEANNWILSVRENQESQAGRWSLPGGDFQPSEAAHMAAMRTFVAQTSLTVSSDKLRSYGEKAVRINGIDTLIHFFGIQFETRPTELAAFTWISIFAWKIMPNLNPSLTEAFDIVYRERIWQRVSFPAVQNGESIQARAEIIFRKNQQTLRFNCDRRLIIALFGKPASGVMTQAEALEKYCGLMSIGEGDEDVMGDKRITALEDKGIQLPIEMTLGMLVNRLSKRDCQAGYILRRFPSTPEDCDPLLNIFVRNTDLLVPIHLEMSDADVQARFGEDQESRTLRLQHFHQTNEAIFNRLATREKMTTLQLSQENSFEVFHRIALQFQTMLDKLAQQDAPPPLATPPIPSEPAKPPVTQKSRGGISTTLMFAGALIIAFAAGAYFKPQITKKLT